MTTRPLNIAAKDPSDADAGSAGASIPDAAAVASEGLTAAASPSLSAEHARVFTVLGQAVTLFNAISDARRLTIPPATEEPVSSLVVFSADADNPDTCVFAKPTDTLKLWTFDTLPGVYIDAENGLVGFLKHTTQHNRCTFVHFTMATCSKLSPVGCADGATETVRARGARLRFLACMFNMRYKYPNWPTGMKDIQDMCSIALVGNDPVVEAGCRLLLTLDRTDDPEAGGVRVYEGAREEFGRDMFQQLASYMWKYADLLEAAIEALLLPARLECGTSADCADAVDDVDSSVVTESTLGHAYRGSILDEWVTASNEARTFGDFMFQVALMTDEALFRAAQKKSLAPVTSVAFGHVAAMAAASMRYSQHLLEKLIRQTRTYYRILGYAGTGFVKRIATALTAWDGFLESATALADVFTLLLGRMRRVKRSGFRKSLDWDAEGGVRQAGVLADGVAVDDDVEEPPMKRLYGMSTLRDVRSELESLCDFVPVMRLDRLNAKQRGSLLAVPIVQSELVAYDGCLQRIRRVVMNDASTADHVPAVFVPIVEQLYRQLGMVFMPSA
jgi:hypothetical protein